MSISMKMEGFRDLDRALAELPAGTARGVVRRVMKRELAPVANMANAFWPGADDAVFKIGSKLVRSQPAAKRGASIVNMFVGADRYVPHAHLIEWGTGPRHQKSGKYVGAVAPSPALTPAWEMNKDLVLRGLGAGLWEEISRTLDRRARRAAKGK